MTLSAPCIRRPVGTLLLAMGILLLGAAAYSRLPIASLPAVERPTIVVRAHLPGASAETIAASLAQPLERELGIIPGIVEMASFSAMGGTQVTIQFDLAKDIDSAAGEVQAAISAAQPNLPKDLPYPPYYRKSNPSGFAVMALALTSDVVAPGELYTLADSVVVQKLSELPGVAEVRISGAERSAVRIQVAPRQLANMRLSLEQVRSVVRAATLNLPKGSISDGERSYFVAANDQAKQAADYRDLVVAYRGGAAVLLRDIATVEDGVINNKLAGWYGNRRAVVVFVYKQPEANVVAIVDAVKAILPELKRWIPPTAKVDVLYDRTTLIRASIADVQHTIAIVIALVVLVTALFLKRFWATVIPGITIPVALAATMVAMGLAGYSLDNLSLMAITISIGFIVDDAVIIVENIVRLMDEGKDAVSAALEGTRQVGFTIISITGALIGALVPVLFMPDVVGRYFREFAVTLAAAIVASAAISLTLTPMLCGRLLARRAPRPGRAEPRQPSAALACYLRSLDWALAHPATIVALLLLTLAGTASLFVMLPKGFMPNSGYRHSQHPHSDDGQCLLCGHGAAAAQGHRRHPARSRRQRPDVLYRDRQRLAPEQRLYHGQPETTRAASGVDSAGDRPVAPGPRPDPGRADVLLAVAGSAAGRAKYAVALSIHNEEHRPRRAVALERDHTTANAGDARVHRCRDHSRNVRSRSRLADRPRARGGIRRHPGCHQQHAV